MTTGYTQADLDKIRSAMVHGVREISVGGRKKVFHSLTEMQRLADDIEARLVAAALPARPPRRKSGTLMVRV